MDDIELEDPTYVDEQDQKAAEEEGQAPAKGQIGRLNDLEENTMLQIITVPVIRAQRKAVPEAKHSSPVFSGSSPVM